MALNRLLSDAIEFQFNNLSPFTYLHYTKLNSNRKQISASFNFTLSEAYYCFSIFEKQVVFYWNKKHMLFTKEKIWNLCQNRMNEAILQIIFLSKFSLLV